jgi:hypothetical protein
MAFQNKHWPTHLFQSQFSITQLELLDCIPAYLRNSYACDFHLGDVAFHTRGVDVTAHSRKKLGPSATLYKAFLEWTLIFRTQSSQLI